MARLRVLVYSLVLATLISSLAFVPFPMAATTAVQIEFLLSQVRNATGSLAGGHVHFYAAGTTTNKDVYLDINKTPPAAANPYTLDANGTALLYGDGTYRVVIQTAAGVTVYDRDNLKFEDLATDFINSEYVYTLKPRGLTGNDTGNITGYDNITGTTRVRAPSIGSASYTDNGYFLNIITKDPWFDVRAYGAGLSTTNGTDDWTAAIQAAIDAAAASTYVGAYAADIGSGTVFIPPGKFRTTSPLTISNSGVTIRGSGIGSTMLYTDFTTDNAAIIVKDASGDRLENIGIYDMRIEGDSYTEDSPSYAIRLDRISRFTGNNLRIYGYTKGGFDFLSIWECSFSNITISAAGLYGTTSPVTAVLNFHITASATTEGNTQSQFNNVQIGSFSGPAIAITGTTANHSVLQFSNILMESQGTTNYANDDLAVIYITSGTFAVSFNNIGITLNNKTNSFSGDIININTADSWGFSLTGGYLAAQSAGGTWTGRFIQADMGNVNISNMLFLDPHGITGIGNFIDTGTPGNNGYINVRLSNVTFMTDRAHNELFNNSLYVQGNYDIWRYTSAGPARQYNLIPARYYGTAGLDNDCLTGELIRDNTNALFYCSPDNTLTSIAP